MIAEDTMEELQRRFKPENARNLSANYLISIRGQGGGSWLVKIKDGALETERHELNAQVPADCTISVDAEDLDMIMKGKLSAMTAAMSGVLAIDGELGLAMQLVPIFFEGQAPFI